MKIKNSPIKNLVLLILFSCFLNFAAEATMDPEEQTIEMELKNISKEMQAVADQLRADRHDNSVQIDQKNVSDRLQKLIKAIEEAKPSDKKHDSKKKPLAVFESDMKSRESSGSGGNASGKGSPPTPTGTQEEPPKVTGNNSRWAQLPPAARDEMLQTLGNEVPLRWRKKLEAYFLSIAAEETKKR